jgi:hypothetical protein
LWGQSGKDYLEKVRYNYEDVESFEVYMNYMLFKGFNSDTVLSEYNSVFYKKGDNSYRKINDTQIVVVDGIELNIDHVQKLMILSTPRDLSAFDFNLKNTLKQCDKVIVGSRNGNILITMIIKDKIDLPFGKMELEIDKKHFIKEVVIYYNTKTNFAGSYFDQDYDFPKLVVQYNGFKTKWKDKENLLQLKNYISVTESGIFGAGIHSSYQILDYRK